MDVPENDDPGINYFLSYDLTESSVLAVPRSCPVRRKF